MIQIQTTFTGYAGRACSLFSAYDEASRILVVSAEGDYRTERRAGCVVITNVPDVPRDALFTHDDIMEAIDSYFALKTGVADDGKSARLAFGDRASRANPEGAIERDGFDARGPKYRVSDSVTCAQMAALAACWYVSKGASVEDVVDMAETLRQLQSGRVVTL
ncbi:MAG: hypothetical protein JNM98_18515 [Rhodocyclaceae bacterium]|nr:hypothetical protein [Rhodocyclaceae bacterium]